MALENPAYSPLPPLVLAMFLTRSEYDRFVRQEAAGSRVGWEGPGSGRGLGSAVSWGALGTQVWRDPGNLVPEDSGGVSQAGLKRFRRPCPTAESPLVPTP